MTIRIDALPATASPSRDHVVPAMDGGQTVRLSVGQILDLLVASAPGALDTLNELAAALGDDENFAATMATALAARLEKTENLSDLPDKPAALTSLGFSAFMQALKAASDGPGLRTLIGLSYADAAAKAEFRSNIGVLWEAVDTVNVSGSPSSVAFTGLSGTKQHKIIFDGIRPATDDAALLLEVQTGGDTWQTSGYEYAGRYSSVSGGADVGSGLDSYFASIPLTRFTAGVGVGNASGECATGEMTFNPGDTNSRRLFYGICSYVRPGESGAHINLSGSYGSANAITGVRLKWSASSNFANVGTVRLIRAL